MKLNRGALILCGLYTGFFILLYGWALHDADAKGSWFLSAVSMLPAGLFLGLLGMDKLIPVDSWMNSPLFLFPLSLLIVYFVGWALSALLGRLPPDGEGPLDWRQR